MVRSMRMIPTDKVPTDTLESMKQLRSVKGGVRNVFCRHALKRYVARFIVAKVSDEMRVNSRAPRAAV